VDMKGRSDIIYTITYPCGSLGICVYTQKEGGLAHAHKVFRFGSKNVFAPVPLGDQCGNGTFVKLYHNNGFSKRRFVGD